MGDITKLTTFLTTTKNKLDGIPVINRRFVWLKDSKQLFIDYEDNRSEVSDVIIVETYDALQAILAPLENKFYFCIEKHRLYRFNVLSNAFYPIGGKQDIVLEVNKTAANFVVSDKENYTNKLEINLSDYLNSGELEVAKEYEYIVVTPHENKEYSDVTDLYPAEEVVFDENTHKVTLYVSSLPDDKTTPYKFNLVLSDTYH